MRYISTILALLLVVAITVASTTIAYTIISNYIKSRQPRGEVIDAYLVVRKTLPVGGIGSIKASLFISCSGPGCDNYKVDYIVMEGYDRISRREYKLSSLSKEYRLKHGITRIDIIGYYSDTQDIDEIVVTLRIYSPSTGYRVLRKSASIG